MHTYTYTYVDSFSYMFIVGIAHCMGLYELVIYIHQPCLLLQAKLSWINQQFIPKFVIFDSNLNKDLSRPKAILFIMCLMLFS